MDGIKKNDTIQVFWNVNLGKTNFCHQNDFKVKATNMHLYFGLNYQYVCMKSYLYHFPQHADCIPFEYYFFGLAFHSLHMVTIRKDL